MKELTCDCPPRENFYGGFTLQAGAVVCSTCHRPIGRLRKSEPGIEMDEALVLVPLALVHAVLGHTSDNLGKGCPACGTYEFHANPECPWAQLKTFTKAPPIYKRPK